MEGLFELLADVIRQKVNQGELPNVAYAIRLDRVDGGEPRSRIVSFKRQGTDLISNLNICVGTSPPSWLFSYCVGRGIVAGISDTTLYLEQWSVWRGVRRSDSNGE